jgi:chromate transporter
MTARRRLPREAVPLAGGPPTATTPVAERVGTPQSLQATSTAAPVSLAAFLGYFVRLGTIGFGGPIALAGAMERDLVGERRWATPQDYKEGLTLAQLAPGPLAAQLAIYLGWARFGVLGATLVGLAFVGPSFIIVVGLSALYVRFGGLPWMQGVFYGVGAAVIAVLARSAARLARSTLGRDRVLWLLFAVSAVVTAMLKREMVWLIVASGVVALVIKGPPASVSRIGRSLVLLPALPAWLTTGLAGPAAGGVLWTILWYFAGAALFVFGSGLAVVPFLYAGVVRDYHWLTDRQFLDAVAVSMITPGPVVITVAFIGYLVSGPLGALTAAIGIFLPVYVVVLTAGPALRRFGGSPRVRAFIDGVTAAATGAIAGAVIVLGRRALVDVPTAAIALGTLLLISLARRVPEPVILAAACLTGLAIRGAVWP